MARRAVQALVREGIKQGLDYRFEAVMTLEGSSQLSKIRTQGGNDLSAGTYVFACGPWLPKMFPELLNGRITVTREEVFFFG